ncbi:hypothetical protein [Halomonas chromatireducens]|uniref:Uncharacterized protein n=1 Tax=Halomonas chromatireducens TaxID=507626 RepID=A0A120JVG8_9GAMM|nr:hypothetical protein [Halomonas chromatireducens]AMC99137.1 hypothetical protein LOKO_00033 [Halomonas chromatireducens]
MLSMEFLRKIGVAGIALGLCASPLVVADSPQQQSPAETAQPSDPDEAMGAGRTGADADIETGTEASVEIDSDTGGEAEPDAEADFNTGSEDDWQAASKQQADPDEADQLSD